MREGSKLYLLPTADDAIEFSARRFHPLIHSKGNTVVELKTSKPEAELPSLGGHVVLDSYKLDAILVAKKFGKRIGDFLPDIHAHIKPELNILARWKAWFTFKRVPWAVTRPKLNQYKLWKIWEL